MDFYVVTKLCHARLLPQMLTESPWFTATLVCATPFATHHLFPSVTVQRSRDREQSIAGRSTETEAACLWGWRRRRRGTESETTSAGQRTLETPGVYTCVFVVCSVCVCIHVCLWCVCVCVYMCVCGVL